MTLHNRFRPLSAFPPRLILLAISFLLSIFAIVLHSRVAIGTIQRPSYSFSFVQRQEPLLIRNDTTGTHPLQAVTNNHNVPHFLPVVQNQGTSENSGPLEVLIRNRNKHPLPTPSDCPAITANPCIYATCDTSMFSYNAQDYYLYTRHFVNLTRPGVYLDIAANDYKYSSNTYFFDRCLQWRGVCVEPNPTYHEGLLGQRTCHVVPTCVGSTDGQRVTFQPNGEIGAIVTKRFLRFDPEKPTLELNCTTMRPLLVDRLGMTDIDYLSLDVEGHEISVLRGLDLDSVRVKVMTIEAKNPKELSGIERFLAPYGYSRHVLDREQESHTFFYGEYVFVHQSVKFGHPE